MLLSACASDPEPAPVRAEFVGWDWKPYRHQRQIWMAAFDGGAAINQAGYRHVLTNAPEWPLLDPSSCREERIKQNLVWKRCAQDPISCPLWRK